ncbi:MAG: putative DNA binding domain-containing protein [Candidatus ainarchaeum sp.]|nr:putative DNA binding domain-containing protein [Candidatus ainarchaeum sp.]
MIFLDLKQVLQVIDSGESQEIEFKESFHSSQKFSEIMCGFANTYGGIILLGVNNKKQVIGVLDKIDEVQQKISCSAQSVSPPVLPSIEVHEVNGKKIVAIVVQRAIDSAFHTFQGVIWVKIGSTLKKIEGNQIVDFLRGKQILCFDETPTNAKIEDLDINKLNAYLKARKQADYFESHSIEDFLVSLKLATKNGDLKIKNAALLVFAKDPIFFNPQIEMKLVRFDGNEPVKIIAHELVQSGLVEGIEKALSFVKSNISKSIQVKLDAKREEQFQYPIDVIREAIVNAVAHRDYFSKDAIQIYIFNDRLEITNPGSLPLGLPRELFGTLSVQRNPLTYRILRDYGYVEGLGSGVPRMINSMRKQGLADPDFGIYEHFFRAILKSRQSSSKPTKSHADLNKRQIKAIEFLGKNKSIKTKTYMKINNVSFGTARLDINEMIKLSYLKKIGSYKGAYYILKTQEPSKED